MVFTFVVRLVADRLSEGKFVGEVEHVGSGRTAKLRSPDDLVRFAARELPGTSTARPSGEAGGDLR